MAEYQQLVIDQFKEQYWERRLNPRKTNNLSIEIIGKGAFWRKLGLSPQGNDRPSSYHVTIDNIDYPIEFVNKQWCYLIWDNMEKFRGYWVKPSNLILQGQHSLGWIGNKSEIATPTVLSQYRDRAKSASTQGEQLSPQGDPPVDDDGVDTNPFQTELLAQVFTKTLSSMILPNQSTQHKAKNITSQLQSCGQKGSNQLTLIPNKSMLELRLVGKQLRPLQKLPS